MRLLFPLLIVIPMVELALLIKIGQSIGLFNTLMLIIVTALIGSYVLRQQGAAALFRVQEKLARGELPAKEVVEGFFIAVGGVLLLTPGVMTDIMGLICLLPVSRTMLISWAGSKVKFTSTSQRSHQSQRHPEGDFHYDRRQASPLDEFREAAQRRRESERHGVTLEGEYERKDEQDKKDP
ncbi:FxsA family protein [Pokkaliibacter sp. CJK22405]|uniref:FxsA family protein n=1 Tax=Pokkaliibacter sp. CJK22405 TaxID=3384615 RepID=UPI0039851CEB